MRPSRSLSPVQRKASALDHSFGRAERANPDSAEGRTTIGRRVQTSLSKNAGGYGFRGMAMRVQLPDQATLTCDLHSLPLPRLSPQQFSKFPTLLAASFVPACGTAVQFPTIFVLSKID